MQQKDLLYLYGGDQDWSSDAWETTDDRVRGGSSTSHLTPSSSCHSARFHGHLDTSTLGGAGFASQQTKGAHHWDLSGYDGVLLRLGQGSDGKKYVITLKDEIPGRREDGRMKSGLSYEAVFRAGQEKVWLPWGEFHATYRGRPKDDAKPLDLKNVKRVGLMMRSFFDEQDGDFSLELCSIAAAKSSAGERSSSDSDVELEKPKREQQASAAEHRRDGRHSRRGWRGVFCGLL